MNSRGLVTVDFVFTLFLTLLIAMTTLSFFVNTLDNEKIIEEEVNFRLLIDKIANSINQVNSNEVGNIKEVKIPNNLSKMNYNLIVKKNKVIFISNNKKGESTIFPVRLADFNNNTLEEIRLNSGEAYKIKKSMDDNNISMIQIYRI
ncbi:hypothetical protein MBCUT_10320 [Methanobrevibacter cuticularis]|uniref:Uncharacterized protein n=1 Tax=Methanobrevibacter cuticularis TaxID=47311 RepID=A0A166E196_9EURY|nr:hypothetical protein [Methanobrevibacter cuticularis]KZX16166.1 hypothetical protein MBCUT_10320 [Methanobrevibacter cuticularis]